MSSHAETASGVIRPRVTVPRVIVPRVIVLWAPDWPITAVIDEHGLPAGAPIALLEKERVIASSPAARLEGVQRGLRLREAQARCPALIVLEHDAALTARAFEPVIAALEEKTPEIQVLRPGLLAVKSRGPAHYYGGERRAAILLAETMVEHGSRDARAGVADGLFAAEQAARSADGTAIRVVAPGDSAAFLAPLPIALLDDPPLLALLDRLGIRSLGDFAALDEADVLTRFGPSGARRHGLARGVDAIPHRPRTPPAELELDVEFEPALELVEQVAFALRTAVEEFVEKITAQLLACTAIRVELEGSTGGVRARSWLHPQSFAAADIVDRVRWQLQGSSPGGESLRSAIARVRILPEALDGIGHHESGLWGPGAQERIHHQLARVQSMLGHGAVLQPHLAGGRGLAERQTLVPWGDPPPAAAPGAEKPWPGRLPDPLPGTVYPHRHAVEVLDAHGAPVRVDARGTVSGEPTAFSATGRPPRRLRAWAGPWPLQERWWSGGGGTAHRFQAVDENGSAWLLVLDIGGWWAEARYD